MNLYSTNSKDHHIVPLEEALFHSLPPDNGLYMPVEIPVLPQEFFRQAEQYSFPEIAYTVAKALLKNGMENGELKDIIEEAVNFPAPVEPVMDDTAGIYVLELFHGPSLAFKDFGARFMSRLMAYFLKRQSREIHILVATSGDTGGAVALGFLNVPGIKVTILYPSGKVSAVQEQQLTTNGSNIEALEVAGSFDDCQRLVKQAFLDKELNERLNLSSANSINIARLIPQTFYYFNAYAQLRRMGDQREIVFSVPSGNFGNLTAGLIAQRMGLPIHHFVAATNINDEVPKYLATGIFEPKPSLGTLSNAMDVGNPSNFVRILDLFNGDLKEIRKHIAGFSFTDEETRHAIGRLYNEAGYVACPHTAVAYLGLKKFLQRQQPAGIAGVFLSTAHPCKFLDVYEEDMKANIPLPPQILTIQNKQKQAIKIGKDFASLKSLLLK